MRRNVRSWLPPFLPPALALLLCVAGVFSAMAGEAAHVGPGVLEPRLRVLFSSEFALPVARVVPRAGDDFKSGDVLIEFDAGLATVNLEAAEAAETAARINFEGVAALAESRQVTSVELEAARQRLAETVAKVAAARRELTATTLRAPFSGRVAERHINDFEWAARGAALLTVVDDTVLEVRFILSEEAFGRIRAGMPMELTVPAVGGRARAWITRVGAVFDSASRTFDVWASLDNSEGRYRAGMTALVDLSPLALDTPWTPSREPD